METGTRPKGRAEANFRWVPALVEPCNVGSFCLSPARDALSYISPQVASARRGLWAC